VGGPIAVKLSDFDFDLPRERIALRPARPRDAARLLKVDEGLADREVAELPKLLRPGDLLVVNDTAVFPARLAGRRRDAEIDVTLLRPTGHDPKIWNALARPAKRLRSGDEIVFDGFMAVVRRRQGGEIELDLERPPNDVIAFAESAGRTPLPPYIAAARAPDAEDRTDYQTIFARRPGAVAAPTAGLHFTPALVDALAAAGVGRVAVTLHVGAGTFLPIRTDDLAQHVMHSEWGEVGAEAAAKIEATRAGGGRVVAVGTTSLRLVESAAADGTIRPFAGETSLFITPGYSFRMVDLLLTNFHLPRSTLFVLVCAFAGRERMLAAYRHAIAEGYRFYSYGDACLLKRSA
jgi:S-adenosylmethionine:tRNA ribosyltransferase-isomerase